jgi:hypothetical protein
MKDGVSEKDRIIKGPAMLLLLNGQEKLFRIGLIEREGFLFTAPLVISYQGITAKLMGKHQDGRWVYKQNE